MYKGTMKEIYIKEVVAEIEQTAKNHNISIASVLRHADVDNSTFYRWKNAESDPFDTVNKVIVAVNSKIADVTPTGEGSPLSSPTGRET